jgi:hypothetical protein
MSNIDVTTDFMIPTLPFPMLRTLQLPANKKGILGGIISLGSQYVHYSLLELRANSALSMPTTSLVITTPAT